MQEKQHSPADKSIVFIGFTGVGRTTVAQLVARTSHRKFIDIDEQLESAFAMPITEIFQQYGEEKFREKEKELSIHHSKQGMQVISLGGGAFIQKEIRDTCLQSAIVVHLDIEWENWQRRIPLLMDSRPILQERTKEEIAELFQARKAIYNQNHLTIATDEHAPEAVAQLVIEALQRL